MRFFRRIRLIGLYAILGLLALGMGTPLAARAHAAGFRDLGFGPGDAYQIGSEWGKHIVTKQELDRDPVFRRAAFATASLGGGTAFYLGRFADFHVIATNHHVCPDPSECMGASAQFPLLGIRLRVTRFFGTWSAIDLALLAVEVQTPEQERALAAVAGNFAFRATLHPGEPLLTIGFGSAGNPMHRLVANYDRDCKVFSGRDEFRFMADPDTYNPGEYKAWSFANGCDVSHGDSGSAMVDRMTGEVVGIIWTGRVPKDPKIRNSNYLDDLLRAQGPEIWTELSYAVPAPKIGEVLANQLANPRLGAETRIMLNALLAN
ncbi:MAG: trypsin-like peptidase domain-containing protein [Deltaproteobacteria bacterium]|nr:trypsin-like peptidase domain-containing protein [Deltaproteobacteria bacterium]